MKLFAPVGKFFKGVRTKLKEYPVAYAVIGAIGIVLFWRGVWYMADFFSIFFFGHDSTFVVNYNQFWDGAVSTLIGFVMLFATGLFVTDFIGSQILSTVEKEEEKVEKIARETESEEKTETQRLKDLEKKFEDVTNHLDEHLESIEKKLEE
ncbi:MAG: hypothetical protein HY432_02500 [Candidatus Liptonbacteria bacterium]|nr:hypothetical protein [Candidatus Liptonbacteria bacterium]